jgi:hypothetical protein
VLIIWHTQAGFGLAGLGLPNYQVLASRFDDVHRQGVKAVDRKDTFHLSQQANEQAEVSAGQSNHSGDDLSVRK